jgi:hypothetical protein
MNTIRCPGGSWDPGVRRADLLARRGLSAMVAILAAAACGGHTPPQARVRLDAHVNSQASPVESPQWVVMQQ